MLWPKNNSYKKFDNEIKFLLLENFSPPSNNFSNGPSLSAYVYIAIHSYHTFYRSNFTTI